MDKKITKTYEQVINDSNGIMVASLTAQSLNGTISNISISINTIDSYQANKDKVISSFNDFLASVKSDNQQSTTLNNVESTSDDEISSAEVISSDSTKGGA